MVKNEEAAPADVDMVAESQPLKEEKPVVEQEDGKMVGMSEKTAEALTTENLSLIHI